MEMLKGALACLKLGHPMAIDTDVGPLIDEESYAKLTTHKHNLSGFGKEIGTATIDSGLTEKGYYFAPCAYEIDSVDALDEEFFGPVLHVVSYERQKLDELIEDINKKGYGLTFGLHSRIDMTQHQVAKRINTGNIYVNRTMIGAVVGSQPFGGHGLSGTGPKAGGPNYLQRFAQEKVISIDTTATGGNTSLVSLEG
jgi:Delta 1-pyrroline-5-carboxylate dehydrogenase